MRRFQDRAVTKYNYQMNNNRNQAELAAVEITPTTPSAARAAAAATTNTNIESSGSGQESSAIGSLSALNRGKFIKSKSSPSSLTTHKFGLRPTPSPPRLIIDHQTGDIVERYPENPVYLRTFQPIEDDDYTVDDANQDHDGDDDDDDDDDTTQNQIDDSFATISSQHQHQNQQPPTHHQIMPDQPSHQQLQNRPNNHRAQQQQHGQVIPPPHTGKVYFAPPATNNNLFDPHQMQHNQTSVPQGPTLRSVAQAALAANAHPAPSASFRRALNNLSDAERTDIAIVTEPEDYSAEMAARPGASAGGPIRITATSAAKANALLAKQQPKYVASTSANKLYGQPASSVSPSIGSVGSSVANSGAGDSHSAKWRALTQQQQQQQQQQMLMMKRQKQIADAETKAQAPTLDDLNLYNFCYSLRILLVLLISASIVNLLVSPLNLDCTKYRPTYTYISIITASVNLIFVTIFTLFWYCNSVSRTLYQNLSSSAFIVTIYSILVCINFTICLVFFFINTCHFQKMLVTHSVLAEVARYNSGGPNMAAASGALLASDNDKFNYNSNNDNYGRSYADENEVGTNSMRLETVSEPARYSKLGREHLAAIEIVESIEKQLMADSERLKSRQPHDRADSDTVTLNNGLHSTNIEHGTSRARSRRQLQRRQLNTATPDSTDDPTVIDDQLPYLQQQPSPGAGSGQPTMQPQSKGPTTTSSGSTSISDFFNQEHASGYEQVPEVSPIEAAWEYIKEQARLFRRHFYKFLIHYDLKFIGALHALCAACFQYLAIKVAVVRSYYCTPGGPFA